MRQDPDVILVGEVRDHETAEMAFRAAMTGHQVYSTLHTNSAIGALPRLRDIGIIPEIMAGNIIGIVAQRLIRKLCKFCKAAYQPSEQDLRMLQNDKGVIPQKIYKGKGCTSCDNSGLQGAHSVARNTENEFRSRRLAGAGSYHQGNQGSR